jgi:hypothetical protein
MADEFPGAIILVHQLVGGERRRDKERKERGFHVRRIARAA